MYRNKTPRGGRSNIDPVIMVKLLAFQQRYRLSNPELEREASLRIDFMHFLGYPERHPTTEHRMVVQRATMLSGNIMQFISIDLPFFLSCSRIQICIC